MLRAWARHALIIKGLRDALEASARSGHLEDPLDDHGFGLVNVPLNVPIDPHVVEAKRAATGHVTCLRLAFHRRARPSGDLPTIFSRELGAEETRDVRGEGAMPERLAILVEPHSYTRPIDRLQFAERLVAVAATEPRCVAHDQRLKGRPRSDDVEQALAIDQALHVGAADSIVEVDVGLRYGPALRGGKCARRLDLAHNGLCVVGHTVLHSAFSSVNSGDHLLLLSTSVRSRNDTQALDIRLGFDGDPVCSLLFPRRKGTSSSRSPRPTVPRRHASDS